MASPDNSPPGIPAPYVCPKCGGPLWSTQVGEKLDFQCHTGHFFTGEQLLGLQSRVLESALWTALRLMSEHVSLLRRVAGKGLASDVPEIAQRQLEQAVDLEQQLTLLEKMLLSNP